MKRGRDIVDLRVSVREGETKLRTQICYMHGRWWQSDRDWRHWIEGNILSTRHASALLSRHVRLFLSFSYLTRKVPFMIPDGDVRFTDKVLGRSIVDNRHSLSNVAVQSDSKHKCNVFIIIKDGIRIPF